MYYSRTSNISALPQSFAVSIDRKDLSRKLTLRNNRLFFYGSYLLYLPFFPALQNETCQCFNFCVA